MNPEGTQHDPVLPPLAYRVGKEADALAVAEAVVAVWRDVDAALRPIIGQRGVAALFDRSLHLTAVAHPWLAPGLRDSSAELRLTALKSLFVEHSPAQALSGGSALLETFRRLLVSLIGPALTERLLMPVWGPSMEASR